MCTQQSYEVYRFCGTEFSDVVEAEHRSAGVEAEPMLKRFVDQLLESKGLMPA